MTQAVPVTLMVLALSAFALAVRLRRTTGIPWARVVASDTSSGQPLTQPLFSRRYGLTGRPDYLLETRGGFVPVEVKPGRQATRPYDNDLMQLAAYCLLVEEAYACAPPYGLLRYAHTSFRIDYTPDVREYVLDVLDEMREVLLDEDECARSHDNPARCRGCGFAAVCEDALT